MFVQHFRGDKNGKNPSFTVVGKLEDQSLVMGVSRCSENDQFCKKTGRDLAEHRIEEYPIVINVDTEVPIAEQFASLCYYAITRTLHFFNKKGKENAHVAKQVA